MNRFCVSISQYFLVALLLPGALLLAGCATSHGSKGPACQSIQQPALVNGSQESMPVTVCKRPDGRAWDAP